MINLIYKHTKFEMYQAKYVYLVARRLKMLILYNMYVNCILEHDGWLDKPYSSYTKRRQVMLLRCHISRTLAMKSVTAGTTQ